MKEKFSLINLDVSRETIDNLNVYVDILRKWNTTINLVSKGSITDVWKRHILDSAQLFKFVTHDMEKWLDIGSGAGFPGLVIAILAKGRFTNLQVTLIESDKRKCVFLNEVVRELDLNVKTLSKRIEDCPPHDADVISARALTQLENLLSYFTFHGRYNCKGLFLKGKKIKSDIESVKNIDMFKIKLSPSEVDRTGYIIEVGKKENGSE